MVVVIGVVRALSEDVTFGVAVSVEARVISTDELVMFMGCFVVVIVVVVVGVVLAVVNIAASLVALVVDGGMVVILAVAVTVSFAAAKLLLSETVLGNAVGWLLAIFGSSDVVGSVEVAFAAVAGDEMAVVCVKLVVTVAVGVIVGGNVAFCVYSFVISAVVVVVVVFVGGVLTVVSVDASLVVDGDVVVILVALTVSFLVIETVLPETVLENAVG